MVHLCFGDNTYLINIIYWNNWCHKHLSLCFFPSLILEHCNSGFSKLVSARVPRYTQHWPMVQGKMKESEQVPLAEIILIKPPRATNKFKMMSKLCSTFITTLISLMKSQEQFNIPLFPVSIVFLNRLSNPGAMCATFVLSKQQNIYRSFYGTKEHRIQPLGM